MRPFEFPVIIPAILWLLAFLLALMPFEALETHFFAGSIILLCFSVLTAFFNRHESLPRSPLVACGLLFWLAMAASVYFSALRFESFLFFSLISALPLSFLMFLLHPDKERLMKLCAFGLGIIIALLSLWAIAQYFFLPGFTDAGRAQHPFDNPNSLAGFLSFGFFGFLGFMLAAEKRAHTNIALLLAILLFAGILATGSRAGILSLLAGIVILLLIVPSHARKHIRCLSILGICGLLAALAASFLVSEGRRTTPLQIMTDTASGKVPALWTRPDIWSSTWDIIRDHMWTGTGIGTFMYYYPEHRAATEYASAGYSAHNDPLQFWAEMGVAGPLLFYAFILLAAWRMFKALAGTQAGEKMRLFVAVPFCALGALTVHAHISSHFYVLPTIMAAGLMLAFWFYATGLVLQDKYMTLRLPDIAPSLLVLGFLIFMTAFTAAAGSEIFVRQAQNVIGENDLKEFAHDVNAASALSHRQNARAFLIASAFPLGILEAERHFMADDDVKALKEQAEKLLDEAGKRNPRLSDVYYEKARLARMNSAWNAVESYFLEALRVDPLNLKARRTLAGFYRSRREERKAYDVLKEGIGWRYPGQNTQQYYLDVSMSAVQFGDLETHKLVSEKINAHKP